MEDLVNMPLIPKKRENKARQRGTEARPRRPQNSYRHDGHPTMKRQGRLLYFYFCIHMLKCFL